AENMAINIADLLGKSLAKACWKPESRQQVRGRREGKDEYNEEQASNESANDVPTNGYERPRALDKTL
ncbi:hypothetical protein ACJX0J_011933, partial [Zea mays]